jgi:DNA primase
MPLNRASLPSIESYCESHGIQLVGRGQWRTGSCPIHGGSDSLRVNTASNGWCCMACGAKGGNAVALHMAVTGLDFVAAAKDLGSWNEGDMPRTRRPTLFSAQDALTVLHADLHLIAVIVGDLRRGVLPAQADWDAFLAAASRVLHIAEVAR